MKRASKKRLSLAVGGIGLSLLAHPAVHAATQTWNNGAGSDWFVPTNWSNMVVPGPSDIADFGKTAPTGNTVNLSQGTLVGAIVQDNTSTQSLTVSGTGITISLNSQPYTETNTAGTFSLSNVVLADTTTSKNLSFASGVNLDFTGAQNTIAVGQSVNETLAISGVLTSTGNIQIDGEGTSTTVGGNVFLPSANQLSNGTISIGTVATTSSAINQAGTLIINPDTGVGTGVATGSDNIIVNEQSQLLINSGATAGGTVYFGSANTTITLDGSGNGTNSGALRNNHITANNDYIILSPIIIGTALSSDGNTGDGSAEMTAASAGNTIDFAGAVSDPSGTQFDKAGAGTLEYSNPNNTLGTAGLELGNGIVQVDAGSSIGAGNLIMFQTSSNTPIINFFNSQQTINDLVSEWSNNGNYTQTVNIDGPAGGSGMTLTLNQNSNSTFGFQASKVDNQNQGVIAGSGTLVLSNSATGVLTLNASNSYSGGTIVSGGTLNVANGLGSYAGQFATSATTTLTFTVQSGSATGTGDVTVNKGGKLTTGLQGGSQYGAVITGGSIAGNLNVNNGGIVAPGGLGNVGQLDVGGNLNANAGSIFDFGLGGSFNNVTAGQINLGGTLSISSTGTADVINFAGSPLATGTVPLFTFGTLAVGSGSFQTGTTPNPLNQYALQYNGDTLDLVVTPTSAYQFWSLNGSTAGVDGSGLWYAGGTNFFIASGTSTTAAVAYSNTSTNPVIIGFGGAGGTITLASNVTVGGPLAFSTVTSPYTIANSSNSYSLTLNGGIIAANSATIAVPTILGTSQTFNVSTGQTLTVSGNMTDNDSGYALNISGGGTTILTGSNSFSGGTTVSQGTLQVTTAALPAAGGVNLANSGTSLVFSQPTPGTYAGVISGSGSVIINNNGTGSTVLSNTANSYSGNTVLEGGVLAVDNVNEVGSGASSLIFDGGTLQALADLNFPGPGSFLAGAPQTDITLTAGTNTTIDNHGFNVVMNQTIEGVGNLVSEGSGNLTLTGEQKATAIGEVSVLSGTLTFACPANESFGISGTPSGGNVNGDIVISEPMELRLSGGEFTGTGLWSISGNNVTLDSKNVNSNVTPTLISNNIVLNAGNVPADDVNIFGDTLTTLSLTGVISGNTLGGTIFFGTGGKGDTILSGSNTYNAYTYIDNSTGGAIQLGANNTLPTATFVHVTGSGILDLNGYNQTIAELDASNTGATVINNGGTTSILTINGAGPMTYSGFLEDGTSPLGITLAASNTGDVKLSGNNQTVEGPVGLTGPITILGGRLEPGTTSSLGAPSNITVGGQDGNSQLRFTGVSGILTFSNTEVGSVNTASPITLTGMGGYTNASGTFDAGAISVENTSTVTMPDNITLAASSDIQVDATSSLAITGNINGTGGLAIQGGGTVTMYGSNSYSGVTNNNTTLDYEATNTVAGITGTGTLIVGATGPTLVKLTPTSGASTVGVLMVNSGSNVDLTNNPLYINYSGGTDPIGTIQQYLSDGYQAGWSGGELMSSSVATLNAAHGHLYGVGYIDSALLPVNYSGTVPPSGEIEILPTISGDATLSGSVSFYDFQVVLSDFGKSNQSWDQGDFDYTGTVDFFDFQDVLSNFGATSSALNSAELATLNSFAALHGVKVLDNPAAGLSLVSVPEPASMGLFAAAGLGLLSRRRRNARA